MGSRSGSTPNGEGSGLRFFSWPELAENRSVTSPARTVRNPGCRVKPNTPSEFLTLFNSLPRRQPIAHRRSQGQKLDGRLRDQAAHLFRERRSVENRRQCRTRSQTDVAWDGSPGNHPIPEGLALQFRLLRAEGCFERSFGTGKEVDGCELDYHWVEECPP